MEKETRIEQSKANERSLFFNEFIRFSKENELDSVSSDNKISYHFPHCSSVIGESIPAEVIIEESKGEMKEAKPIEADLLDSFFGEYGFETAPPKSIINHEGTTIFTSAGVQVLDSVIFKETELPDKNIFIAQPVVRSQFMGNVAQGISTSFVNIATEIVNPKLSEHFNAFHCWFRYFEKIGFKKNDFSLSISETEPKWGDKKFKNIVIRVSCQGLEIGDAVYIYDMPQNTRPNISISDIGFGLERINWLLRGGSYFEIDNKSNILLDHCKTLSLLAGSGLQPSNKAHGYRFRQLSKRLVRECGMSILDVDQVIEYYYDYWKRWANLPSYRQEVVELIKQENSRNLNRMILDQLKEKHADVDLDINQSTASLIKSLKGTSVSQDDIQLILKQMYGSTQ